MPITVAVSAVAFEPALAFDHGLRTVPKEPKANRVGATSERLKPATHADIEPWELHSELVLVSPEVCERARELLPERDPDAFLPAARAPVLPATFAVDEARHTTSFTVAVVGYTVWRLLETARTALLVFWGAVAVVLLAEALH